MTLSVVIRTYTDARWDDLVAAVESVSQQTRQPDQLVLVVDHDPELLARVRRKFPGATVVASATRGSSGAWNTGVRHATGDIIAFIDDDAAADADWIERLLAPYDDRRVVGVGGAIVPRWVEGAPAWFPPEFHWVVGCTYRGLPESRAPVRNLIGCNMSFRRDALEKVGRFHEMEGLGHMGAVPVGGDETELCIRLRQRVPGAILLYEPAAVVHHTVPPSRARFGYFRRRCALEGRSKAAISQLAGTRDGLSTESAYVLSVLPAGIVRGSGEAIRGDIGGARRAGAILVGTAVTASAYLATRAGSLLARVRR